MRKSAKTAIRNNNANNVKTVAVRTVAPKATENDVEEVIETVVENGVNYGSPNIKMMNVITIFRMAITTQNSISTSTAISSVWMRLCATQSNAI